MTGDGPAAAVAALSAALGADPGRGDLWGELATALVAAGRPREAWDAAVRAVELAPRSAASHRAIGMAAAALDDPRQAESAYRHALHLDPADVTTQVALSRLGVSAPTPGGRRRAPDPPPDGMRQDPPASGGRRRAPEPDAPVDPPTSGGRRRAPEPDPLVDPAAGGGRRRAPEPDPLDPPTSGGRHGAVDVPTEGGRRRAAEAPAADGRQRPPDAVMTTAAGLPAWLAPTPHGVPNPLTTTAVAPDWASPPGPPGPVSSAVGATRVPSTEGWRHGLVTAVRIGWVLAVVCYVGLVFERTAPYTAGALAGVAVALGAYARIRWLTARTRRPPPADRPPTVLVVAAAAATVAVVPAAMVGALTVARLAAIVAVSCLTLAAVLLGRRP